MTSSSRGVIPVVRVDDQVIGDGSPGPMTASISNRYEDWTAAHLEAI
jgi:branched-subunit amino acid aminotransferase/4-amino-4-deoxychorismate lyase